MNCPTGKNTYPNRATANRALYAARAEHARSRKVEKRVYKCGLCGCYHLTSTNPKRPRKWAA